MMARRKVPPNQLPLPGFFPDGLQQTVMVGQAARPATCIDRDQVIDELRWLERRNRHPICAPLLADLLGVSERTLRYHLRRMEKTGQVARPNGPRSGWVVAATEK